jgi:hypothetical protein
MALNPVDIEVLEVAWKSSNAVNQQLNSQAVLSTLPGVSEDDFYDSLEIMERSGYVKRSREIAPRPPSFSLTSRGVLKHLEELGEVRLIQIDVEQAIAEKPDSTQSQIVTKTNHPPLGVAAIIDMLEDQGDIRVRRGIDGTVKISQVNAALRRRVKDGDY